MGRKMMYPSKLTRQWILLIGNTSSNCCFSTVIFVFGGVTSLKLTANGNTCKLMVGMELEPLKYRVISQLPINLRPFIGIISPDL